jgi:hypothetical protein
MTSLESAIARRNARLRAWRWVGGVPVEGGWRLSSVGYPRIVLCCLTCGRQVERITRPEGMRDTEILAVLCVMHGMPALLARAEVWPPLICPHLAPLLSPEDPPEVEAAAELELLTMEAR